MDKKVIAELAGAEVALTSTEIYLIFLFQAVLLTVDEAAKALNIAPGTLRNWISNEICPFVTMLVGDARRIHVGELGAFIDRKRKEESQSKPKRGRGRPRKAEALWRQK